MSDSKKSKEELRKRLEEEQRVRDEDALDPAKLAVDDLAGRRHWRRSRLGYITGLSAVSDGIDSIKRAGTDSKDRIEDIGKAAFAPSKGGRAVGKDIADPHERFKAAMFANGKSLADVNRSVANTYRHFWFYVVLTALALGLGVVSFVLYGFYIPSFPLFDILFRAMPLPILGALVVRSGYTNWMFRKRRLDTLSAYLSSGEILPRKPVARPAGVPATRREGTPMSKSNTLKALAIAACVALSFLSVGVPTAEASPPPPGPTVPAPADPGTDIFTTPADGTTDKFVQMLSYLIPNVGPIPEASGIQGANPQYEATKVAFMAFSGTLLFLAAMMSFWQIISGLVASAKEGTVLGKAYHEVWAPIRVVFGFGMLAPIAGGLCAAQIVCLYLVVWGGNLANVIWTPYITAVTQASTPSSGAMALETIHGANLPIANETIKSVFEKELCWHLTDAYLATINHNPVAHNSLNRVQNPDGSFSPAGWEKHSPNFASEWMGTNYDWESINYGIACGQLEVRTPRKIEPDGTNPQWVNENTIQREMAAKQLVAMKALVNAIRPIAQEAAQTYMNNDGSRPRFFDEGNKERFPDLYRQINELRQGYVNTMVGAARDTLEANQGQNGAATIADYRNKAIADGWAASGTYYVSLARLQSMVYTTSTQAASFSTESIFTTTAAGNIAYFVREKIYGTEEAPGGLSQFHGWWNQNFEAISPEVASDIMKIADTTGGFGDLLDPLFEGASRLLVTKEHVNPLNPMQNMIDLGNRMMLAGGGFYVAASAVGGFASGGKDAAASQPLFGLLMGPIAGGISGVVTAITSLAGMMAIAIIAAGAVHAFVIPMIPYVMTAFFVGGMALLTAEALVAAPLWAFFHVRMDGDSFVSDVQKPGYMIAFNLLLRPALMIFGLILSYLVFGAMAWFVEHTFYQAATALSASTSIGPIGAIVFLMIVTYIHFQMAVRAFSMILQVPDRVTRWFGQGGERLGEEEDAGKATAFIVGQATGKLDNLARGGALAASRNGRRTGATDGNRGASKVAASITSTSKAGQGDVKGKPAGSEGEGSPKV